MPGKSSATSIGAKFGRLTVIEVVAGKSRNGFLVNTTCECGGKWQGAIGVLRRGGTKSCGCISSENTTLRNTTHGLSALPEYEAWKAMKKRCSNPQDKDAHLYRDKGIEVCSRWKDSFEAFYSDMGPRPSSKHSVDRKESSGNYEPGNCRWATATEQARNTSRNVLVTYEGVSKTLKAWTDDLELPYYTIKSRLADGWSVEKAFTDPVKSVRQGVTFQHGGKELTLSEWSRELGIGLTTLHYRLRNKWPPEAVFTNMKFK